LVEISNILTLRYDPSSSSHPNSLAKEKHNADLRNRIKHVTPAEVSRLRQIINYDRTKLPTSEDLENEIRRLVRLKIEKSKANRVAIALSSGVDSILILSLIRREFPHTDLECLNVTFDEYSTEAHVAAQIAESKGAGFQEILVDNPLKDLPKLLSIIKEPRWNVYQYYFIEKAKSISNLLFTGDGGDELFAGYTFRYNKFLTNIRQLSSSSSWKDKVRIYLSCHERDWVPDQEEMFSETRVKFDWAAIYELLRNYFDNKLDPLEQVLLADYNGKLMYDFIPTNERFFRHLEITGVAPMLSSKIIDMSMKIPASLKYDFGSNTGKVLLREIIKRNNASANLRSNLTDGGRKKIGFGMNLTKFWFNSAKEIVTSTLERGRIFEDKIINKAWYAKSLDKIASEDYKNKEEQEQGPRYISKMLQLLSLEIWYKLFVTHEISASHSI
jgi:asparagine synthase (glutamine-hydrolysing)